MSNQVKYSAMTSNFFTLVVAVVLSFGAINFASIAFAQNSNHQANETSDVSLWVTSDRLKRYTCPSTDCGVVGYYMFREAAFIFEEKGEWLRTSKYYTASCKNGLSEFVDEGNAVCVSSNGIENGMFAEWIEKKYLSATRPPDPAENAEGIEKVVAGSDDFHIYEDAFVKAAQTLIDQGRCKESDFKEIGGWAKSGTTYRDQPVYFTYCGGMTIPNRIYLNAESGHIFK